jgi:hypothetical protein
MGLNSKINGGVFSDDLGRSVMVIWAKTSKDNSEEAGAEYILPARWNSPRMNIAEWDYSKTKKLKQIDTDIVQLSSSPIFIFSSDVQTTSFAYAPLEVIQKVSEPEITIYYNVDKKAFIDLDIINKNGKRIKSVLDQKEATPGRKTLQFSKKAIPSGVYFVRLIIADTVITERIVIQ